MILNTSPRRWLSLRRRARTHATSLCLVLTIVLADAIHAQPPASLAPAQPELAPASIEGLIGQADQLLANGQPREALEIVRRILDRQGSELVKEEQGVPTGFIFYRPVRQVCQRWIASLASRAPAALQYYRERVDPVASHWFQQAADEKSGVRLHQIVDQFPNSSIGQHALLALGDRRLEAGDVVAARAHWHRLFAFLRAPGSAQPGNPQGISLYHAMRSGPMQIDAEAIQRVGLSPRDMYAYPDSTIAPAAVIARLVLASLVSGELERARWEFTLLEQLYPDAEGSIAGLEGRYTELLPRLLREAEHWPGHHAGAWTSFAGGPDRRHTGTDGIDLRVRPRWSWPLLSHSAHNDLLGRGRHRIAEGREQLLSYHPVTWDGRAFVHDGVRVRALELEDGRPAWSAEDGVIYTIPGGDPLPQDDPVDLLGVPRFTSTIHDGLFFARMGAAWTSAARSDDLLTMPRSLVVGLDLESEGKLLPGFPIRPPGRRWSFEGSPVSDGISIYQVERFSDQVRSQFFVASYSVRNGRESWRQPIHSADTIGGADYREQSHHLLTLDHGTLYFNSSSGVIAAMATRDGQLRWMTGYPRAGIEVGNARHTPRHFFRDLAPCLLVGSSVICAPADCDRVFALSAATGRLIWQTDAGSASGVTSLLGVVGEQLICSGDHLYWLDVYNGALEQRYPHLESPGVDQPRPEPAGWGRGVISGERVYWPARGAIHVLGPLAQRGEWQLERRIDLTTRQATAGNLILDGDRLLIAGPDRLFGFQNDR